MCPAILNRTVDFQFKMAKYSKTTLTDIFQF